MLGPFIDTVVICTMTALVVIVSGAYANPDAGEGVEMTRWAFGDTLSWFPVVLNLSVFLFAYSTMISWSYYGEKAWQYLFGDSSGAAMSFRVTFLVFVVLGAISSLKNVIDFSDLMILSMAFPNIIGGIILAPRVKRLLYDYWNRYQAGEFKVYSCSKERSPQRNVGQVPDSTHRRSARAAEENTGTVLASGIQHAQGNVPAPQSAPSVVLCKV